MIDLVVLVDDVAAVRPQAPVHPAVAVARGVAERHAAGRVVASSSPWRIRGIRPSWPGIWRSRLSSRPRCGSSSCCRCSRSGWRSTCCRSCRKPPRSAPSRHTSCRDSRRRRSRRRISAGTDAAANRGPRTCPGRRRYWPRPRPSAARPRRISRVIVDLDAGRLGEGVDQRDEGVILRLHEVFPAQHRELRAFFRLPWRRLRPGFRPFGETGAAERCCGCKRGAAGHQAAAGNVGHVYSSLKHSL